MFIQHNFCCCFIFKLPNSIAIFIKKLLRMILGMPLCRYLGQLCQNFTRFNKFGVGRGFKMNLLQMHFDSEILSGGIFTQLYDLLAARVGLMHIGVFILLLLSGERNFGVRLNKPYSVRVPMDIPVFTGTHADFLIIVSRN